MRSVVAPPAELCSVGQSHGAGTLVRRLPDTKVNVDFELRRVFGKRLSELDVERIASFKRDEVLRVAQHLGQVFDQSGMAHLNFHAADSPRSWRRKGHLSSSAANGRRQALEENALLHGVSRVERTGIEQVTSALQSRPLKSCRKVQEQSWSRNALSWVTLLGTYWRLEGESDGDRG